MRIAVYGDSYAERRHMPESGAWWRVLESLGHEITCFAESSSSFIWSAQLVDKYAQDFDFNIWCTTSIARHSIQLLDQSWFHMTAGSCVDHLARTETDPEKQQIISAFKEYIKHLYHAQDDDFVISVLCDYFLKKYDNLMLVPAFENPGITGFSLSKISAMEEDTLYPGVNDLYKTHDEQRVCHMSTENNRILATLINENLRPGIFSTDLKNFQRPSPTELLFKKK